MVTPSISKYTLSMLFLAGMSYFSTDRLFAEECQESEDAAHYETTDGSLFFGKVLAVTDEYVKIDSGFGELKIPILKINRINGDKYIPGRGLLHKQTLKFQEDGTVISSYRYPVPPREGRNNIQLLLMGKIITIKDLDDRDLPYTLADAGPFSKAQVYLPSFRLPAIQLTILQKNAAEIVNNQIQYTFQYTPAWEQVVSLDIEIPAGYKPAESSHPLQKNSDEKYSCEQNLTSQEGVEWKLVFEK